MYTAPESKVLFALANVAATSGATAKPSKTKDPDILPEDEL